MIHGSIETKEKQKTIDCMKRDIRITFKHEKNLTQNQKTNKQGWGIAGHIFASDQGFHIFSKHNHILQAQACSLSVAGHHPYHDSYKYFQNHRPDNHYIYNPSRAIPYHRTGTGDTLYKEEEGQIINQEGNKDYEM